MREKKDVVKWTCSQIIVGVLSIKKKQDGAVELMPHATKKRSTHV